MFKVTVQVASTLCACVLLFILLGQHKSTEDARYWHFFVVLVYLLIVAFRVAGVFSYKKLLAMSLASSVIFVVFYLFIAYLWFPGIAKDFDFALSVENVFFFFTISTALATIVFLCFSSIKFMCKHF